MSQALKGKTNLVVISPRGNVVFVPLQKLLNTKKKERRRKNIRRDALKKTVALFLDVVEDGYWRDSVTDADTTIFSKGLLLVELAKL